MLASVEDAARLSGITRGQLYGWIRGERLTVTRPAGRTRGLQVDVLEVQELAGRQRGGRLPRKSRAHTTDGEPAHLSPAAWVEAQGPIHPAGLARVARAIACA